MSIQGKKTTLKLTASYGETPGYHRWRLDGKEINLRIYIRKGEKIPDEIRVDLSQVKETIGNPRHEER